jgi:hypothetical protein
MRRPLLACAALVAAARTDLELTDASCSGAGSRHLLRPQTIGSSGHPPQLDADDADTDRVTIARPTAPAAHPTRGSS